MDTTPISSTQLEDLCENDPFLQPHFAGILAADELPHLEGDMEQGMIVNTQSREKDGEHWIGLWVNPEERTCELLDSFAFKDLDYFTDGHLIKNWLKQWKKVKKLPFPLQSPLSQSCGNFALLFLLSRARGQTFEDYRRKFKKGKFYYNESKSLDMFHNVLTDQLKQSNGVH